MVTVDLQLACDHSDVPATDEIQSLVESTLRTSNRSAAALTELCVRVVGESEMRALNRDYRGKDAPTNVLSFPADTPAIPDDDSEVLGDVVICADVVNVEAAAQGKSPAAHWAHMIVHGTLHLLGYDHEDETEAASMERLEIEVLAEQGFANPYTSS